MNFDWNYSINTEKTMSTRKNETIRVNEVMLTLDRFPVIPEREILKETLEAMGRSRLGIACIVDSRNRLLGIITDGDIRRKLLKVQKPVSAFFVDDALDHAIKTPVTISPSDTLLKAVELMGTKQIWDLPVVDGQGILVGLLHLHPAVKVLLGISE
ncbi:MAG: Arabinose 5-phosphate isomerase KdsD [Syntrophus sp. PtaU1.Bin208]|nr:MAG: Arabinose 5-phosphate isomerase KdsD [Syntrophus sp. PtaU1.Bin208]